MRQLMALTAAMFCFLLGGCGTPAEVKQLSSAQIAYFDTVMQAVSLQSETLLLAADQIRSQAEARIAEIEKNSLARNKTLALKLPSIENGQRETVAEELLTRVARISQTIAMARDKLARDAAAIRAKSRELEQFIGKMKEVHLALDAYLQSEQVGERVLQDVLKQPSVQHLLASTNELLPKVTSTMDEIETLIGGLSTEGEL